MAGGVPRVEQKLKLISQISQTVFPGNAAIEGFFKKAALEVPIPIPTYILSVAGIIRQHISPYKHYFLGEWTYRHHWYHYLFLFSVKMTIPFLCVLVVRLLFEIRKKTLWSQVNPIVLFPTLVYFVMLGFETGANGIRYLFPVLPLLFVWAGGGVEWFRHRMGKWLIAALLASSVISVSTTFPDYLSYFNILIGGSPNGYRFIRDSDVDWGQGLKALAAYMKKNHIEKINLEYFGTAEPGFYGIQFQRIAETEREIPDRKVYAISANYLEHVGWSKDRKPAALVGGSIFIYDFR